MAKTKRRDAPPPPSCKAIRLGERVVYNAFTGRYSVIEVIGDVFIDRPDYPFGPCSLSLEITDAVGVHRVATEIHDLGSGHVIARGEPTRVEMFDRLERHTVILASEGSAVIHPGRSSGPIAKPGVRKAEGVKEGDLPCRKPRPTPVRVAGARGPGPGHPGASSDAGIRQGVRDPVSEDFTRSAFRTPDFAIGLWDTLTGRVPSLLEIVDVLASL